MSVQGTFHRRLLGEIVLRHAWSSEQQVKSASDDQGSQGGYLGELLVGRSILTRGQLAEALSEQRCESFELTDAEMGEVSADVASFIPETLARRLTVLAVHAEEQGSLWVAIDDPRDVARLDLVSQVAGCPVEGVRASGAAVRAAIDRVYGASDDQAGTASVQQSLEEITLEVAQMAPGGEDSVEVRELAARAEETPVVRLVEGILKEAVKQRASDIHLAPGERDSAVRIRIDGVLHPLLTFSGRIHAAAVSRIKILSGIDIAERRLPQGGRCRARPVARDWPGLRLPGRAGVGVLQVVGAGCALESTLGV